MNETLKTFAIGLPVTAIVCAAFALWMWAGLTYTLWIVALPLGIALVYAFGKLFRLVRGDSA